MSTFREQPKPHDSLVEVSATGAFVRTDSVYRDFISADHPQFKPEFGRYHLYVNAACPWANRCVATVRLKGLQDAISISTTHPTWQRTRPDDDDDKHCGWVFYDSKDQSRVPLKSSGGYGSFDIPDCDACDIPNIVSIRDLYVLVGDKQGKYTVPILWDKKLKTIVNNESSEIIRMLTSAFDEFATGPGAKLDLYPESLRAEIDSVNEWIYPNINDGVYRCGFASSQSAYDEAVTTLFGALDRLESILSTSRYLCGASSGGSRLTEADVRLIMTLVRFDEVYVVYFKTNCKRLIDYPNIRNYMRDVFQYQDRAIGRTINMLHIKTHYFTSHAAMNRFAIVPKGSRTEEDFTLPAVGRAELK